MNRTSLRAAVLGIAVLAVSVAGCGDSTSTCQVQGRVTYRDDPVTRGVVNFLPTGGRPLGGPIGADGGFQVDLPAGNYDVIVVVPPEVPEGWKEGDPPPSGRSPIPLEYGIPGKSGLSLQVDADEQTKNVDFALK